MQNVQHRSEKFRMVNPNAIFQWEPDFLFPTGDHIMWRQFTVIHSPKYRVVSRHNSQLKLSLLKYAFQDWHKVHTGDRTYSVCKELKIFPYLHYRPTMHLYSCCSSYWYSYVWLQQFWFLSSRCFTMAFYWSVLYSACSLEAKYSACLYYVWCFWVWLAHAQCCLHCKCK